MTTNDTRWRESGRRGSGWRDTRWLAAGEFAVVLLLVVADMFRLVPLSKVPFLLALGWISLRLRGVGWRGVGFVAPARWAPALALGVGAGAAMSLLELLVTHPLLSRLLGQPPDLTDFEPLVGNYVLFPLVLVAIWALAAFGEELVFRGYLMNRVAGLGSGSPTAWLVSLSLVSVVFGVGHVDQGPTGMLENIIAGLLLGLLYLGCGRTLIVPIVAHGVGDTVDLVLILLGRYPGM